MTDNYNLLPILDLPDVPLIRIFFFLDLEDLLLIVNRVCRRFNQLIKFTPILWRVFEFYGPLMIKEEDLPYILKYSRCFKVFNLASCEYNGHLSALEYQFVSNLSFASNLTWLNLTGTLISSTCFLQYLPKLEILDLSQCENLNDCDFHVISRCNKLECLYLSFNKINPKTITDIVSCTPHLQVLDICGIYLTYSEVTDILDQCYCTLMSFYLSLDSSVNEEYFRRQMYFNYNDLCCNTYKYTPTN